MKVKAKYIIGLLAVVILLMSVILPNVAGAIDYETSTTLDNKNPATWECIVDDTQAELYYNTGGNEFEFNFEATGLEDVEYSLIYYANPYPGNNPGALIATGTASGGILSITSSIDLGMSLPTPPDSNMLVDHSIAPDLYATPFGAKIWLVPSTCYNSGTNSISSWQPERFLFETDLINYIDIDDGGVDQSITMGSIITEPTSEIAFLVDVSNLDFGNVEVGDCSPESPIIITNTGNVPIVVTVSSTSAFWTECLKINDTDIDTWISSIIPAGGDITVQAKVCIETTAYSGVQSGTITFNAQFAPAP